MNRLCIIAPTASKDLTTILDYFLIRNVDAGDKFTIKFEQKCQYLATFPTMGRSYPELAPNLRGIPLDNYVIFYTVTDLCIEIVRVVSGYQDLRSLFPKEE
jgi:toxin ParE1/3/4